VPIEAEALRVDVVQDRRRDELLPGALDA